MSQTISSQLRINEDKSEVSIAHSSIHVLPLAKKSQEVSSWLKLLECIANNDIDIPQDLKGLFEPLILNNSHTSLVIGQLGQSLDGRIATHTGDSKYINGEDCLLHLHRLRAVLDAVVVGVGTAIADDPQLTVRMCAGNHPARVVIDPNGRLPSNLKLLQDNGTRCIIISAGKTKLKHASHIEILELEHEQGKIKPHAIIDGLAKMGLNRLLIEGGAHTISSFIAAKALHRLHILMAPVIIGSGRTGLGLPEIDLVDDALRPATTAHLVGGEVVFDCDFTTYL